MISRHAQRRSSAAFGLLLAAALLAACGTTVPQAGGALAGTNPSAQSGDGLAAPETQAVGPDGSTPTTQESTGTASGTGSGAGSGSTSGGAAVLPGDATTGGTATTAGPGATGPARAGAVAAKGRGWDEKFAYIGVTVQTDVATVGNSIGLNNLDFGDQKRIVEAAIAGVNRRGGVLGRQLKAIFYDAKSTGDANQMAAEACALWTQDNQVIAVSLYAVLETEQMYQCLAKAHVPTLTPVLQAFRATTLAPYAPEVQISNSPSMDRLVEPWINTLKGLGYFGKWDVQRGAPSPTALVKVGILHADSPLTNPIWDLVKKRLEARGIDVPTVITYTSDSRAIASAVTKFRADGVTHVLIDTLAGASYPQAAESQGYRARYGVTSHNYLQPFLAGTAPAAQLAGLTGVGWQPQVDVADAQDPGVTSAQTRCLGDMRAAGASMTKRNYRYTAFLFCDPFGLLASSISAANSFSPDRIIASYRSAASAYSWAGQFSGSTRGQDPTLVGKVRGVQYDTSCSCIKYVGPLVTV